jgi:hypothetical protein
MFTSSLRNSVGNGRHELAERNRHERDVRAPLRLGDLDLLVHEHDPAGAHEPQILGGGGGVHGHDHVGEPAARGEARLARADGEPGR